MSYAVATPIGEGQAYTEDIWSDDLTIPGTGELDKNGTYTIDGKTTPYKTEWIV
jgi:hypothetical protein